MDRDGDHFIAEGIPLTEFQDSAPTTPYPYQLASIVVRDIATQSILASQTTVAPVSTEMRCGNCHHDGGVEEIATGRVETNILTLHDEENSDEYPAGHSGLLMQRRPVLCAECHASNALNAPGVAEFPICPEPLIKNMQMRLHRLSMAATSAIPDHKQNACGV